MVSSSNNSKSAMSSIVFVIGSSFVGVIVATLVWLLSNWYWNTYKYRSLIGVPGPKPLPILGNYNILGASPQDYLTRMLDLQRQYGNFYKIWTGLQLRLVITKPEYLEELLTSNVHLEKSEGYDLFRSWLGDGLLLSTGHKWRQRRKMITPTFHFKIMEEFMEVFNHQIDIMCGKIDKCLDDATEKSLDILPIVNLMSLDSICESAFGTSIKAQAMQNPRYVTAVGTFLKIFCFRFYSGWRGSPLFFRFTDMYKSFQETLDTLLGFTDKVIAARKEHFRKKQTTPEVTEEGIKIRSALLDMLLLEADRYNLTDEDIRDEVNTFMFEGHDTSASAISLTLLALAQQSPVQDKVYEEICEVIGKDVKAEITLSKINDLKYMDIVVKEAIRFYPPVPVIERQIAEDWILDGITIPAKTTVTIFLYGMCHDPALFPEPDKFDPERFLPEKQSERHNFAYIPFSAGSRNCIGQKFALAELKTCLIKFLLRFRVEEEPGFEPGLGNSSVLKPFNGCRMKISRRP